jgi:hypothetical protein
MITEKEALSLAKKFNINLNVINLDQWLYGLNVELEHGKKINLTDVTNDNKKITCKIVIAHLIEDPYYYYGLYHMENKSKKYWKNKIKPSIFNQ